MLDKDYFGLEKVKEWILEYLVVLKLKGDMKVFILCLVGFLGVGKIFLGRLVVWVLWCKFICMFLGGLYDEFEIRGYCKIYIGVMLGRIL